ncbi:hypothetical protein H8B09_22205 [Paenibacillus sp. PR3]|uniref:DUF4829 domain-containing protein n=1 Tax=Paenibacillus terricola TaxID=2763503 RepID=A0ABR8MZX8_9BACL|nr:hypothetical protein [Paenibacillus terricola]MBD3921497.1 hypothetical protein [Paenibacillus terricola]
MAWRSRRRRYAKQWLLLIGIVVVCGWLTTKGLHLLFTTGRAEEAEHVVDKFYKLEQEGDYGSSWELLHSSMKEHFPKDEYIQKRAHIFMQDFKSDSYLYELGKSKALSSLQLKENGKDLELDHVYAVKVTQDFDTLYGPIQLVQMCYVAEENGEWSLLWKTE